MERKEVGLGVASGFISSQQPQVVTIPLLNVDGLAQLRELIADVAGGAGLEEDRSARLALAVNEAATNAIRHGGGTATVTVRVGDQRVAVEIEDRGTGIPAHVTAVRPTPEATGGRGLWLINRLCDEADVTTGQHGTRIRLTMVIPRA